MLYSNKQELIALLEKEGFWTKKQFGQNFLVNPGVLQKIVEAANLTLEDEVIEVGPGIGILTLELVAKAKKLTSVEIDRSLIPILQKHLAAFPNFELKNQDALKMELPTKPYKVVANIPYYITSPLISHFLNVKKPAVQPDVLVLLVQKEVAEKICVKPGDQTILSLQVQAFGQPEIITIVGRHSFFPAPKVDSAVIRITPYAQPKIQNIDGFFTLIKAGFSQRRKKLSNSLEQLTKKFNLAPETLDTIFKNSGVNPDSRPQNLTLEEWNSLTNEFIEHLPKGQPLG